MWTTVVSSILLMTVFGLTLSKGTNISLTNIKPLMADFKGDIHRIIEGARILKKRQLLDADPLNWKLKISRADPDDLPYVSTVNVTFWLSFNEKYGTNVLIGTTEGLLRLFQLSNETDKLAVEVAQSEVGDAAVKAKIFFSNEQQWFVVLYNTNQEHYIQMYQREGRGLEKRQKIDSTGFSDIELVTMKGIHYLIVTSYSSKVGQGFSYQATVTLYYWAQTQFDAIASRSVYGARSVAGWILDGSLYIAVAQEVDDEGKTEVGSPVFLYNSKEENRLVLWEMLQTVGPRKIEHFYVANNHYLVVIGRQDAIIYWWSSGQFLKWQTLSNTAEATDLSVISLSDGEVAIVITLQGLVLFYTLDSSGLYIITLTIGLGGTNLHSLQFIFSGKAYYALALFEDKQSLYRLTKDSHYLPTVQSLDRLKQCLDDLNQFIEERETEIDRIKEDSQRVWLKGSNQTITSKVVVEGKIISNQQSQIRDVIIVRYANIPDVPMARVIAGVAELGDLARDAKMSMDGSVTKSTWQEIKGTNHFKEVFVPNLTMAFSLADITINGVPVSRLHNYGLRKTGDQTFSAMTSASKLYSETIKATYLNGILIDDFLLLHGVQVVSGNLTFFSAAVTDVFVERLNSIATETIITTNTPQNIENIKTFISLNADSIDVSGKTNEVDLSGIGNKIATIDEYNEFKGRLTFQSPLTIDGDMYMTGTINEVIDLKTLIQNTVKLNTEQELAGHYTFKGKHVIDGDLLINGLINEVSLDNLLTVSSKQAIYADVRFLEPLTITRDLIVGEVNGVDLSEEVLKKSLPHQFITGKKVFSKDIQADFVDMSDYITLDGVDPSFLVQDIVQHKQGVVQHNTTVLKDVEVLDALTILGDLNGINIEKFSSSIWSKSNEQNITSDVTIGYLHSKMDLDVSTVKGLDLEKDVVHTSMDETIEVEKNFTFTTVAKSMKTNGTINGIDFESYEIELQKYRNEWEVEGNKWIDSLEINGNLKVTKLNEVDIADMMRPNAEQIISGPVNLTDITFVLGNAGIESIYTDVLNDINLKDFFRNAVLASQSYKQLMNKHFKLLTASNMFIPPNSTIDGIYLDELFRRVVTLHDSQLITAPKIFSNSLKFTKLINIDHLNGFKLNDYLNEVVLTDEDSEISNKFMGNIDTTEASVSGLINGLRIENLAANVFYKSEENVVVKQNFIFEGDIDVDEIFVPRINEISWTDLVLLQRDEILDDGWFLSNVRADGDIFVTGLVNGCDLSRISDILYTNQSTQIIKKNFNVRNVIIIGNLIVKKTLNGVPLEDLKNLITISDDQNITSDAVIDASLVADRLNISNINDENIAFIMDDAVRHSVSQEIKGKKTFGDGTDISWLTIDNMLASIANGVDMEELISTTVWRSGYREIAGDKIFQSLLVDVALVNGFLNGLKLPEDVIKPDVSEHISHPTYFMSDIYVSKVIVYGLIDGVDLNFLINHRITLNTEQNITSELIFKDDVILYDNLIIDGTINDIVLELVAKTKPIYPIQGYKIFKEFHTSGSITASSVNKFDIGELSQSILQYNKNEHINAVQIFEKPVHVHNSVFVEWINKVPLHQLMAVYTTLKSSLQSVLGYLQDLNYNLQEQLALMMSTSQDQIKYAYFTLFQEIDVGTTNRILYGYNIENSDEFSHSLVMWSQKKHCIYLEKCCHQELSYWLHVTKSGTAMMDSSANRGRYYPIQNLSTENRKDFYIWTNSTDAHSEWCTNKNGRMILAANDGGLQKVYIDTESSALLSDVKTFKDGNQYLVASFYYDPKKDEYGNTVVYTYDERYWTEHEILPSFGVLSLDLITYTEGNRKDVLLALGTGMKTESTSYSAVYKWNSSTRTFDLLQNIPSQYVSSTLWIQREKNLFLSMSSVDGWPNKAIHCDEIVSGGQIDIFSYKENYLEWIQSIAVGGVVSMVTFSINGDTYLAAASIQHQTIYIFEWKGFSGFVQIQTISAEARHLNIYYIDEELYLTVASVSGPSKILKLVRKGKSSKLPQSVDLLTSEQQDGIVKKPDGEGCLH